MHGSGWTLAVLAVATLGLADLLLMGVALRMSIGNSQLKVKWNSCTL